MNKGDNIDLNTLTEDEFIKIIIDNESIKNNSDILNTCIKRNFKLSTIMYFNMEAFNDNNCYLFIEKYKVTEEEYKENIKLLDNEFIKQSAIRTYPNLINNINIDENVISWITTLNRDYNINEDIVLSNELIKRNNTIMKHIIEKNPSIIKKLDYLNEDLVEYAISLGYIPTKEDFMHNINLSNYESAVNKAFEIDPSIIIFMEEPLLNYATVASASMRGYVLSMDDIKFNPQLGAYCSLVRPVLGKYPELIKYIKEGCYLLDDEIIKALEYVTITREDFIKNPSLCKIAPLMAILSDKYNKDYRMYSSFLMEDEKVDIIKEYIEDNKSMSTIPFLEKRFGSKVEGKDLDKVVELFKFSIDNDDLDLQSNYFRQLDTLIDGILRLRYDKAKKHILYSDIVAVNNDIMKYFKKAYRNNDKQLIYKLVDKLCKFTGNTVDYDYIVNSLEDYYDYYIKNGYISLINTSSFCNIILNYNRNNFMSNEKKEIISTIKDEFEISNKKKKAILNRKKLDIITNCIICKDYSKLGFTEEEYDKHIDIVTNFPVDRNLRKNNISFDNEKYVLLKKEFKRLGELDKDIVMRITGINNDSVAQYIAKKFTRIKAKSFSAIKVTSDIDYNSKKELLSFNTTDFIIGNNDTYKRNVAKLLLQLDEDSIKLILDEDNKKIINSIKELLVFADIVEEFNIDILIKIFINSKKIIDKLNTSFIFNILDNVLNKIYLVINLAKGYASIDDMILYSLGDEVVAKLGESNCSDYYNLYKKMLTRLESNIPPIYLEYNDYTFKSGDYADPERLLMGKLFENSCIDLNNPGEKTFLECLTESTGDVVLIKDENKELIDRMILIRRGNVVQIVMVALHTLPLEVYNNIANQILTAASNKNDNIDYVVVARNSIKDCDKVNVITNPKFITKFPHADLTDSVVFLGNEKYNNIDIKDINLRFKDTPKATYLKSRNIISQTPSAYELTRLNALRIALEESDYIKERLINIFEPIDPSLYVKTVCGDDWYICIKEDGTYDELLLQNGDNRAIEEMDEIKRIIMEEFNKIKKKTL